jgi:hypothetical protein
MGRGWICEGLRITSDAKGAEIAAIGESTMPARKYVKPDEKVGLDLTSVERKTILKDVEFLDDDYEQALCETPVDQAIEITLSDWDYLGGEISFEAEETDDPKRRKRLHGVYSRIKELLAAYYTHEDPE